MQPHVEAIVKSLVAVAWADGKVEDSESEVLEALIDAFELEGEDAAAIRAYATEPRTLADVPLTDLSSDDRRLLLQHAVLITYADGEQTADERELLDELAKRLHIPPDEATRAIEAGARRAERLANIL